MYRDLRLIPKIAQSPEWGSISPREAQVMDIGHLRYAEIGHRLGISVETVKIHVRHAVQKLGAATRTEAVLMWREKKLTLAATASRQQEEARNEVAPEQTSGRECLGNLRITDSRGLDGQVNLEEAA